MAERTPIRVLMLSHVKRDWYAGAAYDSLSIAANLRKLGCNVQERFADDLFPRVHSPRIRLLLMPIVVWLYGTVQLVIGHWDIIDASNPCGALLFPFIRLLRRTKFGKDLPRAVVQLYGLEHLLVKMQRSEAAKGHVVLSWRYQLFYGWLVPREVESAICSADRVVARCSEVKGQIVASGWQAADRVSVVSLGVPDEWARQPMAAEYAYRGRPNKLLWYASWIETKGIRYFIPAVTRFLTEHADWSLTVMGHGTPDSQVLAAFSPDLHSRLVLMPKCSRLDQRSIFQKHAVFCFPTLSEGFGLALLEAMSNGLAVISTSTGLGADLVQAKQAGLIVPRQDADAIYRALCRLAASPDLVKTFGDRAAELAQPFTWERTAHDVLEVYHLAGN